MSFLIAPLIIYFFVLLWVYCLWKWLHIKRMIYYKEVNASLESYFMKFQEIVIHFDDSIYRSDKAYPVLTAPMKELLESDNHSLESFRQYIWKLSSERNYLEELVWESIWENPLKLCRIKKRALAVYWIEEVLWYVFAILTLGFWVIRSKR